MAKAVDKKSKNKKQDVAEETSATEPLVIDKAKNLVFNTEEEVYQHFSPQIEVLEEEYRKYKSEDDFNESEITDLEDTLTQLFEGPDEVWVDSGKFKDITLYTYIKEFSLENGEKYHYVALTYIDEQIPTFIFLHFGTNKAEMLNHYRRKERIYTSEQGAGHADALSEGDELALGLYKAMLTVRAESDIPEADFPEYLSFRDETVEDADEIWRSTDLQGNVLVTFIKDFHEEDEEFTYITITLEDSASESHYILFSFPTKDKNLVDRYRHGETLHTDDVVQEESH